MADMQAKEHSEGARLSDAHGPRSRASRLVSRVWCRGFTLIEIVVAITIAAMLMGVAVGQMDRMLDWEMKKASNKLASTIRYLYNKAAMEKLYIRLVLDLEEQAYWVEATADPFVVAREGGSSKESAAKQKKKEEEKKEGGEAEGNETEKAAKSGEGEEGPKKLKPPEPTFGKVDSFLLRPTKLPDTVFFKDLQVEHRQGPVEGGKESIYFFPNGYVERAIVNLRDEEDQLHYSLTTRPLSGQVDIDNEYRSLGQR